MDHYHFFSDHRNSVDGKAWDSLDHEQLPELGSQWIPLMDHRNFMKSPSMVHQWIIITFSLIIEIPSMGKLEIHWIMNSYPSWAPSESHWWIIEISWKVHPWFINGSLSLFLWSFFSENPSIGKLWISLDHRNSIGNCLKIGLKIVKNRYAKRRNSTYPGPLQFLHWLYLGDRYADMIFNHQVHSPPVLRQKPPPSQ